VPAAESPRSGQRRESPARAAEGVGAACSALHPGGDATRFTTAKARPKALVKPALASRCLPGFGRATCFRDGLLRQWVTPRRFPSARDPRKRRSDSSDGNRGREPMQMLMIISRSSLLNDLLALLASLGVDASTQLPNVHGRGEAGAAQGTFDSPASNTVILAAMEEEK